MSAIDVLKLERLMKPLGGAKRLASEVLRIVATWPAEAEIEKRTPGVPQENVAPTVNLASFKEYRQDISAGDEKQPVHVLVTEGNELWGLTPDIATLCIYLDFLEASFVRVEYEADDELCTQDFLVEPEELRALLSKGFPCEILDIPSEARLEDYLTWRAEEADRYARDQIFSDREKEG